MNCGCGKPVQIKGASLCGKCYSIRVYCFEKYATAEDKAQIAELKQQIEQIKNGVMERAREAKSLKRRRALTAREERLRERREVERQLRADRLAAHPRKLTQEERNAAYLTKLDAKLSCQIQIIEGCWIWTGATRSPHKNHPNIVYSRLNVKWPVDEKRRTMQVNCLMFRRSGRIIPTGMVLGNTCRNRLCVNPDHAEIITYSEAIKRSKARPFIAPEDRS